MWIILTSSRLVPDIDLAYEFGANAYLVKPSTPQELVEIASAIKCFWLELNHGPAVGRKSAELIGCGT
jgi:CheY-like chemotaxis protein